MLKHEFENLATNGEPIDADLFDSINRDYMRTDETKQQYIFRVFGTEGGKAADIAWKFAQHRRREKERQANTTALRLLRPFLFYRMDAMRKSSDFSVSTLKQLNGATFAELDAAETRLAAEREAAK